VKKLLPAQTTLPASSLPAAKLLLAKSCLPISKSSKETNLWDRDKQTNKISLPWCSLKPLLIQSHTHSATDLDRRAADLAARDSHVALTLLAAVLEAAKVIVEAIADLDLLWQARPVLPILNFPVAAVVETPKIDSPPRSR
jgi:hypothetical protein